MDESRARALLRAERSEVAALLRESREVGRFSVPDSPGDFADAGQALADEANGAAVESRLQDRLGAIDRALARLEVGSYGRSVLSGRQIPEQRLEADPAAELTVEEARAYR